MAESEGGSGMKYMVYTSVDGEIGTYDTEDAAMQAAQDYIDTDLDELTGDEEVLVCRVMAELEITETDTKESVNVRMVRLEEVSQ